MKILVTNPTGNVGRRVVRELLAPEFSVRVIARTPARLPEDVRTQTGVIHGAMDDVATWQRAAEGVEALFFCVPPAAPSETDLRAHYERLACVAAEAIRSSGIRQMVTISSSGKGRARDAGPISALHAMEEILNESGAAIRHLRCGAFMENFLCQTQTIATRGAISAPLPGHIAIPLVAATDVADAALRWLVRRDWNGVAGVAIHGPEDLSYNQAAAIFERVLERPVRYQEMAANAYVQQLIGRGASREYAQSYVAMFAELAAGIMQAEPRPMHTPYMTLSTWTREELLPAIEAIAPQAKPVFCSGVCGV
jgi:uncharacterized protein YbjT (DUF2867 family)